MDDENTTTAAEHHAHAAATDMRYADAQRATAHALVSIAWSLIDLTARLRDD